MAFTRPTLPELISRVEGDIKAGLSLTTLLRRSFLKVLARVLAGLAHLLFGFIQFIERQAFPDTAEAEFLLRWAAIWGITQNPATFAELTLDVTGAASTIIPINTVYRRVDGKEYTVQVAVTLTGSGDTISLLASEEGAESNADIGDVISILSPIAGLDSEATVSAIDVQAENLESIESVRERLLDRIRQRPSGGSANDYLQWAREVPGITRAWVGPQALGPGTVVVYVVSDDEDPITPIPAKITEVFDYIEELRPVTASLSVVAPVLLPMDLTIALKPNNATVRAEVEAEIDDLIFRESALAGSYKSPGVLNDGKILLSKINEAISTAVGEEDHEIVDIDTLPPADFTPSTGELVVPGTITWQTLV
jgi:uncharacterized phage protein gp47/JayE